MHVTYMPMCAFAFHVLVFYSRTLSDPASTIIIDCTSIAYLDGAGMETLVQVCPSHVMHETGQWCFSFERFLKVRNNGIVVQKCRTATVKAHMNGGLCCMKLCILHVSHDAKLHMHAQLTRCKCQESNCVCVQLLWQPGSVLCHTLISVVMCMNHRGWACDHSPYPLP